MVRKLASPNLEPRASVEVRCVLPSSTRQADCCCLLVGRCEIAVLRSAYATWNRDSTASSSTTVYSHGGYNCSFGFRICKFKVSNPWNCAEVCQRAEQRAAASYQTVDRLLLPVVFGVWPGPRSVLKARADLPFQVHGSAHRRASHLRLVAPPDRSVAVLDWLDNS